jgi:NADH-quinone oxidoreductase subunit L
VVAAAWTCLFAPLGATVTIALLGNRLSRRGAGYLASASVLVSFMTALVTFALLLGESPHERSHPSTLWRWLTAGDLVFGLRILVDPLSVFMMLVVSGVGFLIVAYSIGYMDGEDEERRYFAYMALFVFSMLLLVQTGNLLLLLAGWGLVGLCSYLLIGFWHHRPTAIAAAKKAFIMNAFGDATFALALFLLVQKTGSLDFGVAFGAAPGLGSWAANLIALGLLGGAVAKSAQLPLQTWLPDAMEGPTPVSALIHAATMVTAGVYLVVRTHAIFEAAPRIRDLAAGLGAGTLLLAALIALVQTNIKRVIAYSTMSQIGYMFLAAGIGGYANAMFHLMTHAFFKALLFMAAGIVIHSLVAEEDMRKMGGLRHLLPRTYIAFLVGALALSGMPFFAGFFSKDSILGDAIAAGTYGKVLYGVGLLGVFLTALYAFRMVFIVFGGEPSPFVREHLHTPERDVPGYAMGLTVAVLAALATIGGWIQWAILWTPIETWMRPVAAPLVEPSTLQDALTSVAAFLVSLAGIALAWAIWSTKRIQVPHVPALQTLFERKFYFDELYDEVFYRPAVFLASGLLRWVERPLVFGSISELAAAIRELGFGARALQTGLVRTYALAIAASLAVVTVVFLAVR